MRKIVIYGHGGSQNHGNEAIVRGIAHLFPNYEIDLYTSSSEVDKKFGLNKICNIKQGYREVKRNSVLDKLFKLSDKYLKFLNLRYRYAFRELLKNLNKENIYVLEAGDQYCEKGNHRECYAFLNKMMHKNKCSTVMLGCTVNPEILKNKDVIKDLKNYSLIVAREHITYEAMKENQIKNLIYAPCPAFAMNAEACSLPNFFSDGEIIGINSGFLAQGNEVFADILFKNYVQLIQYILDNTNYKIALIPHVHWDKYLSDFSVLNVLYQKFQKSGRIFLLEEKSAPQQKFIISKLKFFVVLRTHATIPALAELVPTVITGYKIKSKGICDDIFGNSFDLLASVQDLNTNTTLVEKFKYVEKHEQQIRDYLKKRMPTYLNDLSEIVNSVEVLYGVYNG